jgi:hypothetical protein
MAERPGGLTPGRSVPEWDTASFHRRAKCRVAGMRCPAAPSRGFAQGKGTPRASTDPPAVLGRAERRELTVEAVADLARALNTRLRRCTREVSGGIPRCLVDEGIVSVLVTTGRIHVDVAHGRPPGVERLGPRLGRTRQASAGG